MPQTHTETRTWLVYFRICQNLDTSLKGVMKKAVKWMSTMMTRLKKAVVEVDQVEKPSLVDVVGWR